MTTVAAERMRVPVPTNLNIRFMMLVLLLGAGIAAAGFAGVDPRLLSALTGSAALGGITYRLFSTWDDCPVLVHVLALAIIGLLLVGAIGQLQLGGHGPGRFDRPVPLTIAVWPGIILRVACVVIAVFWPKWVERRHSPFRNQAGRSGVR